LLQPAAASTCSYRAVSYRAVHFCMQTSGVAVSEQ
jgi:hypothetical protein